MYRTMTDTNMAPMAAVLGAGRVRAGIASGSGRHVTPSFCWSDQVPSTFGFVQNVTIKRSTRRLGGHPT